MKNRFNKADK